MKNQTGGYQIRGRPRPKRGRTANRTAAFPHNHTVKPPPQPRAAGILQLFLLLAVLVIPHLPSQCIKNTHLA